MRSTIFFKIGFILASLFGGVASMAQTNVVPDSVEFAMLKKVYDSLGGSGWTTKTNWPTTWPSSATSSQFGTWYGVTVANGDITKIQLPSNHLVGKIPSNVGILTPLLYLTLNNNTISGSIPSTIGNLRQTLKVPSMKMGTAMI